MIAIKRIYKLKFKEYLKEFNFRSYRNTFFRISNDVLQTIMLRPTPYSCSVDFNILPLAIGIEDLYCDGYSISMLREGNMKGHDWVFEPTSLYQQNNERVYETLAFDDGSEKDIAENMLSIVAAYVINIFANGIDCKSALAELKKYEISIYGKKLFIANSYSAFLMNIKIGNFDEAISYLKARIEERRTNPYNRFDIIEKKRKALNIAKLKNELVISNDYKQTINDILSRVEVDEEFKQSLLSWGEIFANAKFTEFAISLRERIPMLEKEIEQLIDVKSKLSADLAVKEWKYANKVSVEINNFSEQIKLLSKPDVTYFQKLMAENEAKSLEYLKHPSRKMI
jgi:hypothetical protein